MPPSGLRHDADLHRVDLFLRFGREVFETGLFVRVRGGLRLGREFLLEIRALPGITAAELIGQLQAWCEAELLPGMRAIAPDCFIEFEPIFDTPPLDERGNTYLAQAITPLCFP